jgi:hypothetical protein
MHIRNNKLLKRIANDGNNMTNSIWKKRKKTKNIFDRKIVFVILCIFVIISLYSSNKLFDFYSIETLSNPKFINKNREKINILSHENYEYEDYDIIFGNLINATKETKKYDQLVRIWAQEYFKYYLREPPTNYEKWVQLAVDHKCYLHPKYYKQVIKLLI